MLVNITVKPNSKKGPLIVEEDNGLTIFLRQKPHDGEANSALIKLLSDHFSVPKTCIEIKKGGKSHRKVVEILKNVI